MNRVTLKTQSGKPVGVRINGQDVAGVVAYRVETDAEADPDIYRVTLSFMASSIDTAEEEASARPIVEEAPPPRGPRWLGDDEPTPETNDG